jgi:biopolymer transport protein ExbB
MPSAILAATSWWNGEWQDRKAITIALPVSDASGTAPTVVLPIRLHAGNFEYFQDLQPQGADVRFTAADGSPLKHHIESIDALVGLMVAWVEVPVKKDEPVQTIWMYYANPHAGAPSLESVYDADQELVLHFAEALGATPRDATANHNDPAASAVQLGVSGAIGNGAHFDGHGSLRIAARPALGLAPDSGLTFATWVKLDRTSVGGVLYFQGQGDSHVEIGLADTKLYADLEDHKHTTRVEGTIAVIPGEWHSIAVSIGKDTALYVDGMPAGTGPSGILPQLNADILIGARDDQGGAILGDIDEVQISKVARSAWWARVNALGQSPAATLVTYGTDESKGSSGKFAAYVAMMRHLLSQVSVDGLLVITITGLMGLASFQVLVAKAALLRRVEREDTEFHEGFTRNFQRDIRAVSDGGTPAANEDYPHSGLHRMYAAGLAAVEAVIASTGSRTTLRLSSEGVEAIRASLDGALVEVTNRLNAQLVVMTVAIAGAPFLGLLGTVVGVMITFASIAAAGDVNVNTIAPGVAAAMTATVVGLLVAIPSLFGYNWLATRIARRTSTMEVFADQFLSRVGLFALATQTSPEKRAAEAVDQLQGGIGYAA